MKKGRVTIVDLITNEHKELFMIKKEVLISFLLAFFYFIPFYANSKRACFYAVSMILSIYAAVVILRLSRTGSSPPGLKKLKNGLQTMFPLRFGLSNLFISLVLAQWFIQFQNRGGVERFSFSFQDILVYSSSFISLNILVQLINSITSRFHKTRFFLNSVLVFFCYNLGSYHYHTKNSLDFSVISANYMEAFSAESMQILMESVGLWELLVSLGIIAVLAVLEFYYKIRVTRAQKRPISVKLLFIIPLYCIFLVSSFPTHDDLTHFLRTVYGFYTNTSPYRIDYIPGDYPLVNESKSANRFLQANERRPNIFLIMIESFNYKFIESGNWDDEEYTPYFNRLIGRGIYVENFYANSIQTSKGHAATICSIVPSIRSKIFRRHWKLSLNTLPEILKNQGYDTIYFQAHKNLDFDNTRRFMRANGFDTVETAYRFLAKDEKRRSKRWYMRDRVFYKKFFDFLDSHTGKPSGPPIFAFLPTIYNHSGFGHIPKEQRHFYKDPQTKAQRYANSIYLVDNDLKVFFQELEERKYLQNSMIVLTGDHSYPVGDHGINHNEAGFYEESFRVPFILLWPGKVPPLRITHTAYSQMDIAPTILDILGYEGIKNHFSGESILQHPHRRHPVYLVQPYSGRYLGVVRYPYKYLFHEKTGKEYIFNIEQDPAETINIQATIAPAIKKTFKKNLRFIYRNQKLIEQNGIWPEQEQ